MLKRKISRNTPTKTSSFADFVRDASEHGGITVTAVDRLPKRGEYPQPYTLYMIPQPGNGPYYDCYGLINGRYYRLVTADEKGAEENDTNRESDL